MLGQPPLVAAEYRGDPQREALLAQQGVAAVARAVTPDGARFREMRDVFGLVARPRHIGLPRRQGRADRVQAFHGFDTVGELFPHRRAGAGHDLHRHRDVLRIGDLHTIFRLGGIQRPHAVRDHIHGPARHRAAIVLGHHRAHIDGVDPVVRRTRVALVLGTDEGAVLYPRHIVGVRYTPERIRLAIKAHEGALGHQLPCQPVPLAPRAVTPDDPRRCRQLGNLAHPRGDAGMIGRGRHGQGGCGAIGHSCSPSSLLGI